MSATDGGRVVLCYSFGAAVLRPRSLARQRNDPIKHFANAVVVVRDGREVRRLLEVDHACVGPRRHLPRAHATCSTRTCSTHATSSTCALATQRRTFSATEAGSTSESTPWKTSTLRSGDIRPQMGDRSTSLIGAATGNDSGRVRGLAARASCPFRTLVERLLDVGQVIAQEEARGAVLVDHLCAPHTRTSLVTRAHARMHARQALTWSTLFCAMKLHSSSVTAGPHGATRTQRQRN
jgi:hypothetical protein